MGNLDQQLQSPEFQQSTKIENKLIRTSEELFSGIQESINTKDLEEETTTILKGFLQKLIQELPPELYKSAKEFFSNSNKLALQLLGNKIKKDPEETLKELCIKIDNLQNPEFKVNVTKQNEKKVQGIERKRNVWIATYARLTQESYQKLSPTLQQKVEAQKKQGNYEQKRAEIAQIFAQKGVEDSQTVENYLNFTILQEEFSTDLQKEDPTLRSKFQENLNHLNNLLGVITTIAQFNESENPAQLSQTLVENNDNLKQASETPNKIIDGITPNNEELLTYLNPDELQELKNARTNLLIKHPEMKFFDGEDYLFISGLKVKSDQKDIIEYFELLKTTTNFAKEKLENTKKQLKQQLTFTPFFAMAKYLDKNDNLDNQFQINAEDMNITNKNYEIKGTIEGKPIKIGYHLADQKNELLVEETFGINNDSDQAVNLGGDMKGIGIYLPSEEELNLQAEERIQNGLQKTMSQKNFSNQELVKKFGAKLQSLYGYETIVQNRLSQRVEQNLTKIEMLKSFSIFLGPINNQRFNIDQIGGKNGTTMKQLKGIVQGIEQLGNSESQLLREQLKRFTALSNQENNQQLQQDEFLSQFGIKTRESLLKKSKNLSNGDNPFLQFLSLFTAREGSPVSRFRVEDMRLFLDKKMSDKPFTLQGFTEEFKVKYETIQTGNNADAILDEINSLY